MAGRRLLTHKRLFSTSPKPSETEGKRHLVVLGSGWGGFTFLKKLDCSRYRVSLVSPVTQFSFTPLLAQAAVGTLDFRNVIEPVRAARHVSFHHAWCDDIQFSHRALHLTPAAKPELEGIRDEQERIHPYTLYYDDLVISVGSYNQTFNTPGVKENAWFLKDVGDARRIRWRILQLLEEASHPWWSDQDRRDMLSFVIVGGGPTGSEFAAELHDLVTNEVSSIFPSLRSLISIKLLDAGSSILNSFDKSLSDYALKKFSRDGIHVGLNQRITRVEPGKLWITEKDETQSPIPFGLLVWSTGIKPSPLTESQSDVAKDTRSGTFLTDTHLRLLNSTTQTPIPNVFAIGDCASIQSLPLPFTAQVASQKATYLARIFNNSPTSTSTTTSTLDSESDENQPAFVYSNRGAMASIGGARALIDLPNRKEAGFFAWVMWRSAYTFMSMTWRNRLAVPFTWFLNMLFGRDVSRF